MSTLKVIFWILFVGVVAMGLAVACGGGEEPTQVPTLPPTPGEALSPSAPLADMTPTEVLGPTPGLAASGEEMLQDRCTRCHTLDRVQTASKSLAQWQITVERMRAKGAELTDDEVQVLIEYLADTYGP
jgi:cytochrome c5